MTETVKSYRDLRVWQAGMDLALTCYQVTAKFPSDERFGLITQIRRAAVSVPANIAEGQGRGRTREFERFLTIAYGSLMELETHIRLSVLLGYLDAGFERELLGSAAAVGCMLNGLMTKLRAKRSSTDHGPRTTDH
jgi:four helix bundle protein